MVVVEVVGIAVLGLVLGSFVNALVWRLHEQQLLEAEDEHKSPKKRHDVIDAKMLSIVHGRSMCPTCHHQLSAADLVPIVSWVFLRGRCRYCHAPISWQYPVVEGLTAVLFAVSFLRWPYPFGFWGNVDFGLWLIFLACSMALVIFDLRWYLLPDRIVFPVIGLSVLHLVVRGTQMSEGWRWILHAAVAAVFLAGLFFILHTLSAGSWIGFGDVKLAIALGVFAGDVPHVILLLFCAALLGTIIAVPLLVRGKATAKTPLPFGPFLLVSSYIAVLFGTGIISWYLGLFGLR